MQCVLALPIHMRRARQEEEEEEVVMFHDESCQLRVGTESRYRVHLKTPQSESRSEVGGSEFAFRQAPP